MTTVAKILGTHKSREIKQAYIEGRLLDYLTYLVKESDFYQHDETRWSFIKVATYLDDGWQSQQQYTTLESGCLLTLDELGQVMNQIVGGSRYEQVHAKAMGCRWTFAGEWPTRADLGAFLFYVSVENPV